MPVSLKVLMVEDSADDAELLLRELRKGGYDPAWERVDSAEGLAAALKGDWDIIIADYIMPQFSGLEALEILKRSGRDIPFIILSGGIGEDIAVDAMRAGAQDYIMKGNTARLLPAIGRELAEGTVRRQRREAEELRRESERRYRNVVDNASEGIAVIQDDVFKFVNRHINAITGYPEASLLGMPAVDIVHPEDREVFLRHTNVDRILGDTVSTHSFRIIDNGGLTKWLENNGVVIDWDGQPATLNFLTDVTARKEAEQALQESQEQFILFMKHVPGFALIKDAAGRLLYINERATEAFGRGQDEFLGKTDYDLWPKEVADRLRLDDMKVIDSGEVLEQVETFDVGGKRVVLLSYRFLIPKGSREALLGIIAIDITRRKEVEDALKNTKELLEVERSALEKKNIALSEVLERIEAEKNTLKRQFATNIEEVILPILLRLKDSSNSPKKRIFELIEAELHDVASPFYSIIKEKYAKLSPRELEVCRLIKNGLTTKEIAEVLNLSAMTIQKHRETIRKKLGLVNNQTNLNTFLQSLT